MAEDPELDHDVAPAGAPALGGLRRRGIYLLPNLFTTGVLFCGFFAIVQAMNGRFEVAAVAVYVAMVLDGMDGRVARWTNTQSEFGAQYDSIADMVAFGAAPALIAYEWALKDLGTAGWIGAFIYCAGAGIRLARFNANIAVVDKRYFQGLPSPSGAAVLAGFIWVLVDFFNVAPRDYAWLGPLTWVVAVFAGVTNGFVYGLVGIGLAAIFKGSRIINVMQGDCAVVGAISVSAPTQRAGDAHLARMRDSVMVAARALSAEFGEEGGQAAALEGSGRL